MSGNVFLAVMFAAFLHAAWNAIVKQEGDRFAAISLMGISQGAIALCILPFVSMPRIDVWPFIAASAALHTGYKLFLIRAYQAGDLSQVYPLARGTAPLLTAVVAFVFLGETVSPVVGAGILILCAGIALMSFRGGDPLAVLDRKAVVYALLTSLFIASYSFVDGVGARTAGAPSSYIVWMFALDGLTISVLYAVRRGRSGFTLALKSWRGGLPAGALSLGAYWLVIWAMTLAPIAAVAALRETSILFAMVISAVVLRERLFAWRIAAGLLILLGVAAMRAG